MHTERYTAPIPIRAGNPPPMRYLHANAVNSIMQVYLLYRFSRPAITTRSDRLELNALRSRVVRAVIWTGDHET